MALNIFLYLPDGTDNIDFCADIDVYKAYIKQLGELIKRIKKENNVNICYDSRNLSAFINIPKGFIEEKYLSASQMQLRYIMNPVCQDIRTSSHIKYNAVYLWWQYYKCPNAIYAPDILSEIVERKIAYPQESFLFLNRSHLEPCRDYFLVFKDEIQEYPSNFVRIPFVTDADELKLWLKTNTTYDFSLFNKSRFKRIGRIVQGQPVFWEIATGRYWYLDHFHDYIEYEVFNSNREHIGTADSKGVLNIVNAVNGRTFQI